MPTLLHSIFFLFLWLDASLLCLQVSWSFLLRDLVFCWTPMKISVQLLYSSAVCLWLVLFNIFYPFVEILSLFMLCSPDLSEHLQDHYFELFNASLTSISLRLVSETYHVLLFGTYSSFLCFFLTLTVGFCALAITTTSPSLDKVVMCRTSVNLAQTLGCLSKLCDHPSSYLCS